MLYDSLKSETFDHLCALLFNFTFSVSVSVSVSVPVILFF